MIFLTGGNGFIGRNFVEHFVVNKISCKCLIRPESKIFFNSFLDYLKKKHNTNADNIKIVVGDLMDKDIIEKSSEDIDTIIHSAAVIYSSDIAIFNKINVLATKNLIDSAKNNKIKKFVFISSCAVLTQENSGYVNSKREAEKIIIENLQYSSINYLLIRPALVMGEYDTKNIAQIITTMLRYRIALIIGKGTYKIQPVYVKDIVKFSMNYKPNEKVNCNAVTLAPDECISFKEFLIIIKMNIKKYTKKRMFIISIPLFLVKLGIVSISLVSRNSNVNMDTLRRMMFHKKLDNSDAKKYLGYKPTNVETTVRKTVNYFCEFDPMGGRGS